MTSAWEKEGETFVPSGILASFSRLNSPRVLLVDADFNKPRLHELCGIPNHPGLLNLLSPDTAIESISRLSYAGPMFPDCSCYPPDAAWRAAQTFFIRPRFPRYLMNCGANTISFYSTRRRCC